MSNYHITYRPDLQGLRALAVALVVLSHAKLGVFTGGFVGVDIFFVLSGFLISGILCHELEQVNSINLIRFYARRLKRLVPALVFVLFVVVLITPMLLSDEEALAKLASVPFAALWTSNFYFAFSEWDYFDELSSNDLFLHTWSLGLEEQFYLIWPLVLMLFGINSGNRLFSVKAHVEVLKIVIISLSLISLMLMLYWCFYGKQIYAFYLMPARVWEFSLGSLVFLYCRKKIVTERLATVMACLGFLLILGPSLYINESILYPGFWVLMPVPGTCLLIISGATKSSVGAQVLSNPVLTWLGDRSYSLYLWHWPVLILGFTLGYKDNLVATFILIAIAILLSIFSYRFIELPFWKGRLQVQKNSLLVLVGVLLLSSVLLVHTLQKTELIKSNQVMASLNKSPTWRTDLPDIYRYGCDSWYHSAQVKPCQIGSNDAEKTVIVLGDSILAQWVSMVSGIFTSPEWRIVVLTKSACPMVDEDLYYQKIGRVYDVCKQWRNEILEHLASFNADLIITGSSTSYKYDELEWVNGSTRVFQKLSTAAKQVLVIPGSPIYGIDGPTCAEESFKNKNVPLRCKSDGNKEQTNKVMEYLNKAVAKFENVKLLNLNDLVCPNGLCQPITPGGQVVFRDTQHLTDSFVRSVTPEIKLKLNALVSDI